jgi:hypothetical protein
MDQVGGTIGGRCGVIMLVPSFVLRKKRLFFINGAFLIVYSTLCWWSRKFSAPDSGFQKIQSPTILGDLTDIKTKS